MKATITAASYSANIIAAHIERAAMMSNPTLPRRKLVTISASNVSRAGKVAAPQSQLDHWPHPDSCAANPKTRPAAGIATMIGRNDF
jgi:hypothetical protein